LNDISLDPRYNSICGYTDHDIDTVFADKIKALDREKIYHPYDALILFNAKKIKSWQFKISTPHLPL
ncbi:MAG: AAA family ATPase, partial [Proteobacteria bacterium]|nr:AAA family ATPase [Pseudomonadota bacterium]